MCLFLLNCAINVGSPVNNKALTGQGKKYSSVERSIMRADSNGDNVDKEEKEGDVNVNCVLGIKTA